jgi:hypothetical protein
MLGDIGLMVAVYISFRALAELSRMNEVPTTGWLLSTGRAFVTVAALAVIVVAVVGAVDIIGSGTKATSVLTGSGIAATEDRVPIVPVKGP